LAGAAAGKAPRVREKENRARVWVKYRPRLDMYVPLTQKSDLDLDD